MKTVLRLISFGLLMLLVQSCEKNLDIDYHDIAPITVIEAELTDNGAKVAITLTTPMDMPMDTTRLTDAAVILADMSDGAEYTLVPDNDGYFRHPAPGIPDHRYRLTVQRAGMQYRADATMLGPVHIESLQFNWISMPYDKVAVLQGRFTDNPANIGDCYWVKLYRNGKIYMWNEVDDRGAVDGLCTFLTMTSRMDTDAEDDDEVLFDGDIVTFTVSPISRAMHDYLEALQNDSNGPAMFAGDKCLGYFIATSPATETIVFHPDQIPYYR